MKYTPVHPLQIAQTLSESDAYILVLTTAYAKELTPERQVPILIGETEAQAIIMAVEGREAKRPLTHNLIGNIMQEYMLTLRLVTIDRFEEGIFYSTLHISDGFSEKNIDSRTSDAVVLALLQGAEILIADNVLEETSMAPGALLNGGNQQAVSDNQIAALEALLHECEEKEDYERAQEIMEQIKALKNVSGSIL